MSNNNPSPDSPSFGERLGIAIVAFLRALLVLLIIAVLAVVVGAVIYYGLPAIYDRYVQPIQLDVSSLQVTQADQEQAIQQLSSRIEDLTSRINTLEVQSDSDKQTITELQTQLAGAISTQAESLAPMQSAQATATSRLNDLDRAISELEDQLNTMTQDIQSLDTRVGQNQELLNGLQDKLQIEGTPLENIQKELQIVKAMELLTRSRMLLDTNNLGLAQEDLQSASDLLNELQARLPDDQKGNLAEIISRLNTASGNLPNRPILASDDLEIAWQLLLMGLPEQTQTAEVSGTPGISSETATPGPVGTGTLTPTPTPTP
jgi:chaperonin cofactor prefoldin